MKKIFALLTVLLLSFTAFAQSGTKSVGLKDSDVKNYIKNYSKIQKEFDALDTGSLLEDPNFIADVSKLEGRPELVQAEKILEKYGISASNRVGKICVIGLAASLVTQDMELDAETRAMMEAYGMADPFVEIRKMVHKSDYDVVKKNYSALKKLLQ